MNDETRKKTYEDLVWGQGPRVLEIFLEPTCPFSARAFAKLKPLLQRVGEEKLSIRILLHSQPWHIFSSVVTRAILAASGREDGKEAAYKVMSQVFEHREDFVCTDHCRGSNMDCSPSEILARIRSFTDLDLRQEFEQKEVTDLMKRHTRYARQNGIHGSPTFMVNGLVNDKMSSGDEIDKWIDDLGLSS